MRSDDCVSPHVDRYAEPLESANVRRNINLCSDVSVLHVK